MKKTIAIVVAVLVLSMVAVISYNGTVQYAPSQSMQLDIGKDGGGATNSCSCTGVPGCQVTCGMGKRAKCHNCGSNPSCECV